MYQYKPRSVSELYDLCTADDWATFLYASDQQFNTCLQTAFELYIKDCLELQRRDRWEYLMSFANYDAEQEYELVRLFATQGIDPTVFARNLKAILNCTYTKLNCLKIWGVPDSGKSLFSHLLAETFIVCYMNNQGSANQFYLSNMLNKSLIICDELFLTPGTADDFKSVLGGAKVDVDKKNKEKQILSRTPIIITTNYRKFGRGLLHHEDEVALAKRCISYHFYYEFTPSCRIEVPAFAHFLFLCLNQDMIDDSETV